MSAQALAPVAPARARREASDCAQPPRQPGPVAGRRLPDPS